MPTLRLLALLLALSAGPARAGESYFLIMFGAQRIPNNPAYAHTFATFVRATWQGDGPPCGHVRLEGHTVSWLPETLVIRVLAPLPECGHNFGLFETLDYVQGSGERVSMWGPYPIDADLFARARRQIDRLDTGRVRFKSIDIGFPINRVCNCIHAVSEIPGSPLLAVATPGWGEVASYAVLLKMRPWILDESSPQYWVSSGLGLDRYPIIYRDRVSPPASGAFLGPVWRLLGGERDLVPTFGPPR